MNKRNEIPVFVTRKLYHFFFILVPLIGGLFFFSPNAGFVWPIGLTLLLLLAWSFRVGYFYENNLVIRRVLVFSETSIEYSEITKLKITPNMGTTPPMAIIYFGDPQRTKKISLPIFAFESNKLIAFLKSKNENILVEEIG